MRSKSQLFRHSHYGVKLFPHFHVKRTQCIVSELLSPVLSPAKVDIAGHLPGRGDGVVYGGGNGEGQQEVGEGQTEDEDIPRGPHLLGKDSREHHHDVSENCQKYFWFKSEILFLLPPPHRTMTE